MRASTAALAALSVPLPALGAWLWSGADRRWQPEVVTENTSRLVLSSDGFRTVELQHDVILDPWWYMALDGYLMLLTIAVISASLVIAPRP